MSIKTKLTEIANAIRYALGTESKYSLAQMPPLIRSLNSNLKTGDIYYNLFKFDCSKYNDSMIFNQYYYFRNYPEPNTFKENRIIGNAGGKYLFVKDSGDNLSNMSLHFIMPTEYSENSYKYGDLYYDFSNNTFEYDYIGTINFAYFSKAKEKFENLKLSEHFLLNFEDSSKTYSTGLGISSLINDYSYTPKTSSNYQKFFWLNIENGILYSYCGQNKLETKTEICSLEANTDYDIYVDVTFTEGENFLNNFDYKVKVNETEYTGTISYTGVDTFLTGNSYGTRTYVIDCKANTPEKLRWFSMYFKGLRYSNILINPIVSLCESTLTEITDENSPGLKKIHDNCFNIVSNPALQKIDNSSIEKLGNSAFENGDGKSDTFDFHTQIEKINLPALKTVGNYALSASSSRQFVINEFNIPNVETIGNYAFYGALKNYFKPLILNKVTSIGRNAFQSAGITELNLPLCTSLGIYAFADCSNLEKITMDSIETLPDYAFSNCQALKEINMPNLKTIGTQTFGLMRWGTVKTFNLPKLETTGNSAFYGLNLGINGKITFPTLKSVGEYFIDWAIVSEINCPEMTGLPTTRAFRYIRNLKKLRLPKADGECGYAFTELIYKSPDYTMDMDLIAPNHTIYCYEEFQYIRCAIFKSSNLTESRNEYSVFGYSSFNQVYMRNLQYLGSHFLRDNNGLELAYFDKAYTLGASRYDYAEHFRYCVSLKALILAGDETVCSLLNQNAFYDTPIAPLSNQPVPNNLLAKREGYIYVPRALLEDYKTAPNWSFYADSFRAIEDYGGLEGIKSLIYPTFTNTVNLTNQQVYNDFTNPLRNNLEANATVTISNNFAGRSLSEYTGDTNEYVILNKYSYSSKLILFSDLPRVKDFSLEFDFVLNASNCFSVCFGLKMLPTDVSQFTNANFVTYYNYGFHARTGDIYNRIGPDSEVSISNSSVSSWNYSVYNKNTGISELYTKDTSSDYFYVGEKIHGKLVRQGRLVRYYVNGMLFSQAWHDDYQNAPGGYFGLKTPQQNSFGITNITLSYDNEWRDPSSNEIWISSVRLNNLSVSKDEVETVLSKNEFDYYVLNISDVDDTNTVKLISDSTEISDLSGNISTYAGKIIKVTDNSITVYN